MSTTPSWWPNIDGKAEPEVVQVHRLTFNAINDHETAIDNLSSKVDDLQTAVTAAATAAAAAATTSGSSTSSTTTGITFGNVNQQTGTTYTLTLTDNGGIVILSNAAAVAVALPSSVVAPFVAVIENIGVGLVTVTPQSGKVNAASTIQLNTNQGCFVFFDGVNWWALTSPPSPLTFTAVAHEFLKSYNAVTGTFMAAQPAFTDISGVAAPSQLPTPTTSSLGGVEAVTAVAHEWVNSITTAGVPTLSQPAAGDISGLGTAATQNTTGAGSVIPTGPATSTNGDVVTFFGTAGEIADSGIAISSLAPLASPGFTGTPTAPTATSGTNTTQIATTAFVEAAVASGPSGSFGALTTGTNTTATMSVGTGATIEAIGSGVIDATELNGLTNTGGGVAIPTGPVISTSGDVVTFTGTDGQIADSGTLLTSLAPKASPALTGTPTAPTATAGTNSTQIATTAFVDTALAAYAPLASPALTGTPTAPTAAPGTSTTQLATTAFVEAATSGGGTPSFSVITSGTNTAAAMVVGSGGSLDFTGTGTINATEVSGKAITGSGAAIPTGPTGTTSGDVVTFTGTTGQIADSGTLLSSLAPKASPALTGTPTAPTATAGTNTTQIATTAFVEAADSALLVSPALTGIPTAPTAAPGTNTTQIATTAFVEAATTGGTPAFSAIQSGTNTAAAMVVGTGASLTTTGTGSIDATELSGLVIAGAGAAIPTGPASSTSGHLVEFTGTAGQIADSGTALSALAPLASPALTGTPTAPTATFGTSTTQIATTAFVEAATSGGTPPFSSITSATNTTAAMVVGSGASLAASGTGSINATELNSLSTTGAGTAVPTGPTTSTSGHIVEFSSGAGQIADSGVAVSSLAPLASPALTGTPTAPTATAGTNTTQLATTAFVEAAVSGGVGSTAFSAITGSTNTSAAMVVGTGASIGPSGSGVVNANEINAATVPASAKALASNSSHQLVAATLAGSGAGLTTGPTSATANDLVTFVGSGGEVQDSGVPISSLAPLASPALTGTPTAPTAAALTNTTQLATTAFVTAAVAAGVGSTPFANLTTGVNTTASMVIGTGGSLTFADSGTINASSLNGAVATGAGAGIPTGPTSSVSGDVVTFTGTAGQIADSGTLLSSLAPLASPALTGTPTAPTATAGTNTTQLATTAFVTTAIAGGAATPFSVLTTSTNTSATMTVGTGSTLTFSGSGVVNANELNGATVPASTKVLASNSSGQLVAATLAGSGAAVTTGPTTSTSGDFVVFTGTAGQIADSGLAVASFAPINSPAFTGVPTAPTATSGTNTTQLATTAFVAATISGNTGNAVQIQSVGVNPVAPTNGELLQYSSVSGLWVPESALCYPEAPADSPSAYDDEFNIGTTLSSIWTPTTAGAVSYSVNTSPYKSCLEISMPSSGSSLVLAQSFVPGTADFSATMKLHTPFFASTPVFEMDFGVYATTSNAAYMLVETNASFKAFSEVSGTFTQLGSTLTSSSGAAFTGCFLLHVQRKSGSYSFYFSPYPGSIWTLINATAYTPSGLTVATLKLSAGYDSGTGAIPSMMVDWVRINWMFR